MPCSQCGRQEASVFIKQITDNQVRQTALCHACASRQDSPSAAAHSLFLQLLGGLGIAPLQAAARVPASLRCSCCGLRYAEFLEAGRLGCPGCYDAFHEPLSGLLRRIHDASRHRGKRPSRAAAAAKPPPPPEELHRLRRELKSAVEREDFEAAARLRDRIKEVECRLKP